MNGNVYPPQLIDYLVEFNGTRDYFECHEIMEEYWKERGMDADPLSSLWIGLIQVAVGQYHHRRGNRAGAQKMLGKALDNLKRDHLASIGLGGEELLQIIEKKVEEELPFSDFDIPLTDAELAHHCLEACKQNGVVWGMPSRMDDASIIHRHKLRDRSEVISARIESADAKRKQREGRMP
ncbi:DUF309 domain-containing protein [Paenibacillus tarimensis]